MLILVSQKLIKTFLRRLLLLLPLLLPPPPLLLLPPPPPLLLLPPPPPLLLLPLLLILLLLLLLQALQLQFPNVLAFSTYDVHLLRSWMQLIQSLRRVYDTNFSQKMRSQTSVARWQWFRMHGRMVEFSAVMVSDSNRNVVYRSVFMWQAVSYVGYLSPQAMNSVSQVTQLGTATVLWYTTSITVKWEILRGSEHRIIHGS